MTGGSEVFKHMAVSRTCTRNPNHALLVCQFWQRILSDNFIIELFDLLLFFFLFYNFDEQCQAIYTNGGTGILRR